MDDEAYRRYARINLPHSRTIVQRLGRELEVMGAFQEEQNGGAVDLRARYDELEQQVRPFDEDPPFEDALRAADAMAERARSLVQAILATPHRGDRLGQTVRNLFECLGLADEGARVSLECGERPDSLMR